MASVFTGAFFAFGQNEVDVYRLSNTYVQGSARFDAMGGSFGALGAESGCIGINPAGFGRSSVSSFSFGLSSTNVQTKTNFNSNSSNFTDFNVRVPNIAATVVSDVSSSNSGLIYTQISFGLNRVANFNNSFNYSGQQLASLLDVFSNNAYGIDPLDLYNQQPYTSSLAWITYAINDTLDNGQYYYTPSLSNQGNVIHNRTVLNKGGINEWYVALSANYLDKIYFGASVSYNTINFSESIIHKETAVDTAVETMRSFVYQYDYKTKGGGLNVKLGAIFLPTDFLRLGIALHTPTFYQLTDEYTANMQAVHSYGVNSVDPAYVPADKYKYRIWTPTKLVGSLGLIFGDNGCINIDLEYLNYGWGRLKTTNDEAYVPYNYAYENQVIKDQLVDALNIRIGGEWAIQNTFFIRAGYGYYPKGDTLMRTYGKNYNQTFSGGLGIRVNRVYFNASVRYLMQSSVYKAFYESRTELDITNMTFNIGMQYKFDYK
ncbi:hypothetical protein Fluta_3565 [Fluviicola taffensis DSM 16823]|uniref:Membrane protein involved in aromatic hydrocarbon degradation n=2 Tax=Fluviicola TaxID=332102 RepID=F2IDB9_FLUTR|nr:hypothetical protein Fluta_3565 [Fluviicola taffensis DSM 16823]